MFCFGCGRVCLFDGGFVSVSFGVFVGFLIPRWGKLTGRLENCFSIFNGVVCLYLLLTFFVFKISRAS